MEHQSSVGWACGWLVLPVFSSLIEKKAPVSLTVFENKNEVRVHIRFARNCKMFRVCGVIVRMPYLPLPKSRWPNSMCNPKLLLSYLVIFTYAKNLGITGKLIVSAAPQKSCFRSPRWKKGRSECRSKKLGILIKNVGHCELLITHQKLNNGVALR